MERSESTPHLLRRRNCNFIRTTADIGGLLKRQLINMRYFKISSDIQIIVLFSEHVSREQGQAYLDIIQHNSPSLYNRIGDFRVNDLIGNPNTFDFGAPVGRFSPTTLRYVKVLSDLARLFGDLNKFKLAEIGIGYGGQTLTTDRLFTCRFYLFDLPPVLKLASKYLESHVLSGSYIPCTLNKHHGSDEFDLVVSNYAFSELLSQLEEKYIHKVLSKAKRGYLTMNSGVEGSHFKIDKLTLTKLRELLPKFDLIKEEPLTALNNYIIVWGHK